jgi:predicted transcriptional regulator
MKLKKAIIKVKNISDVKEEMKKAFKGEFVGIQKKNEIIFLNFESAFKVFSKNKMQILQAIAQEKPRSIYELAKFLEKDFKSVHTDVKYLVGVGLIELKESNDARSALRPIVKFSGIEFEWAA